MVLADLTKTLLFISPIASWASPGQVGNITFFQTASRHQLFRVFCVLYDFGVKNGPKMSPGGYPKRHHFGTQEPKGAQKGPRKTSRPPKAAKMKPRGAKIRSRSLRKVTFSIDSGTSHTEKNVSIPSLVLTTWCRVHNALCALSARLEM